MEITAYKGDDSALMEIFTHGVVSSNVFELLTLDFQLLLEFFLNSSLSFWLFFVFFLFN